MKNFISILVITIGITTYAAPSVGYKAATNIAQNVVREGVRTNYLCTVAAAQAMTNGLLNTSHTSPIGSFGEMRFMWGEQGLVLHTKPNGENDRETLRFESIGGGVQNRCTEGFSWIQDKNWNSLQSALDAKANANNVYTKNEVYTKTQINGNAVTNGGAVAAAKAMVDGLDAADVGALAIDGGASGKYSISVSNGDATFTSKGEDGAVLRLRNQLYPTSEAALWASEEESGIGANDENGTGFELLSNGLLQLTTNKAYLAKANIQFPMKSGTVVLSSDLASVARSGAYSDLTGTPTIPSPVSDSHITNIAEAVSASLYETNDWVSVTNGTSKTAMKRDVPTNYLKSATSTDTSITVTKQDDTTVGLEVQYVYALTNLTAATLSLRSGEIGNYATAADFTLNLDFADNGMSGDCLLYVANTDTAADHTITLTPNTYTFVSADIAKARTLGKATTNIVSFTRVNSTTVLVAKQEVK